MPMNVQSIAGVSDRINEIRLLTAEIVNKEILPVENQLWAGRRDGTVKESDKKRARELRESIQAKVKQAGLWAPHLPEEYGGCGLGFLEHAYMNEVLAYSIGAASLFGVGGPNSGNRAAQDRLGAGRVYHCMNSIGQMWRAFDLMVQRAAEREVHGGKLETKQFVQGFIADSYIDIQAARLMTIHCAERMDRSLDARTEISAIKIFVPEAYHRVVDRAIQVWGAAGVSGIG